MAKKQITPEIYEEMMCEAATSGFIALLSPMGSCMLCKTHGVLITHCKSCGSVSLSKEKNDVYKCQACGKKFRVEEVKHKVGE